MDWSILVVKDPNLNLPGTRRPRIDGSTMRVDIERELSTVAAGARVKLASFQSNHGAALVGRMQAPGAGAVDFTVPADGHRYARQYAFEDSRP
jgi:3-dehydroquinate dehydratase